MTQICGSDLLMMAQSGTFLIARPGGDEKPVSLRERSEPGANAPTKAQAVGVGPHGTNSLMSLEEAR